MRRSSPSTKQRSTDGHGHLVRLSARAREPPPANPSVSAVVGLVLVALAFVGLEFTLFLLAVLFPG